MRASQEGPTIAVRGATATAAGGQEAHHATASPTTPRLGLRDVHLQTGSLVRLVSASIYKTSAGRTHLQGIYLRALEGLRAPVTRRTIETRFGSTHLLETGSEGDPPVVLFQGGNSLNPLSLAWFLPLASRYRLYAPDTVGHPGFSAETRLSPKDLSYGEWASDVLDALELDQASIIGPSFGAGIALRLAALAPERIRSAALLVPSGVISPPVLPLLRGIIAPMLGYMLRPNQRRLNRAVKPIFTGEPAPLWLEATKASFDHLRLESSMPRPATSEELLGFTAPTLVVAAERDPFFPGRLVLQRAREILPHARLELFEGESHVLSDDGVRRLRELVREVCAPEAEEPA